MRLSSTMARIILKVIVFGNAMQAATFVRVRWVWLVFPVVLWILSLVAWIGTIWSIRCSRVPLWGTTVLPLLCLHREIGKIMSSMTEGLQRSHGGGTGDGSLPWYEERAKVVKVRLVC
jgi:hypothetical protein